MDVMVQKAQFGPMLEISRAASCRHTHASRESSEGWLNNAKGMASFVGPVVAPPWQHTVALFPQESA